MKLYACCPVCSNKLCKGENGTSVDAVCPRCANLIRIQIKDGNVFLTVLQKHKHANV